jgi:hypothetical protein
MSSINDYYLLSWLIFLTFILIFYKKLPLYHFNMFEWKNLELSPEDYENYVNNED